MRLIGVLLMVASCRFSGMAEPDAPGGPGGDGARDLGMFVTWRANPPIPGMLSDKLTISDVTFQVDRLQIVADAGNVMHTKYQLAWNPANTPTAPKEDAFPDAPPGMYSRVSLVINTGNLGSYAYQIHGTWRDNDNGNGNGNSMPKNFTIRDNATLNIGFNCSEMLAAAGSATIGIRLDLRDALNGIDFKNAEEDEDGTLELSDGQELTTLRSRLTNAFKLDD